MKAEINSIENKQTNKNNREKSVKESQFFKKIIELTKLQQNGDK